MLALIDAVRADLDLVTVKTEDLSHTKRIGEARMFRVPVGMVPIDQQRDVYMRALGRQLDAEPYAIVHALDPFAGSVAAERRDTRGFLLVYEVTALPEPEDEAHWLELHERTLRAADRVLVPTRAAAAALGEQVGCPIDVVPPAVDVGALDWWEVRRRGAPRVLYLGGFSSTRDLDTVLEALARVIAHRPIRALFAGERDREKQARLQKLASSLGLNEHVEIRGEPPAHALPALIAAADVCLAPATRRLVAGMADVPQPLLEYLACYRPVVAANVPGLGELVREETEALLYPPGDAGALADAILEVLRDAVLRERITEGGYRRVRDELSSGARRRRLAAIYEMLAPGTQLVDPWSEPFGEAPTGLIELSAAALDALREREESEGDGHGDEADDRKIDTAETLVPAPAAGEPTRPRIPSRDGPIPTDTQPGLVLPDTDPGR